MTSVEEYSTSIQLLAYIHQNQYNTIIASANNIKEIEKLQMLYQRKKLKIKKEFLYTIYALKLLC